MAHELHKLGWVKDDLSGKVEGFVNPTFLVKATELSAAELSKW
jgi:hypothetical protein